VVRSIVTPDQPAITIKSNEAVCNPAKVRDIEIYQCKKTTVRERREYPLEMGFVCGECGNRMSWIEVKLSLVRSSRCQPMEFAPLFGDESSVGTLEQIAAEREPLDVERDARLSVRL